jgi:hypothetical protein
MNGWGESHIKKVKREAHQFASVCFLSHFDGSKALQLE